MFLLGTDLPSNAWLNAIVRLPGESKDLMKLRAHHVVKPIQRLWLSIYTHKAQHATLIQKIYRGRRLRLAVKRKRKKETYCCVLIFAVWRGYKWRNRLWWLNVYATRITALARGKHGRWMAHLQRIVKLHPRVARLVVRIQQRIRGGA